MVYTIGTEAEKMKHGKYRKKKSGRRLKRKLKLIYRLFNLAFKFKY